MLAGIFLISERAVYIKHDPRSKRYQRKNKRSELQRSWGVWEALPAFQLEFYGVEPPKKLLRL